MFETDNQKRQTPDPKRFKPKFLWVFVPVAFLTLEATVRIITYGIFVIGLNRYPEIRRNYYATYAQLRNREEVVKKDSSKKLFTMPKAKTDRNGKETIIFEFKSAEDIIAERYAKNLDWLNRKQKGMFRILCVGGSTTRAGYVEDLGVMLKNRYGAYRVETINLGIDGLEIGTSDDFIRNRYGKYSPDMIILYHGFNDVSHAAQKILGDYRIGSVLARRSYGAVGLAARKFRTGFIVPEGYREACRQKVLDDERYFESVAQFCRDKGIILVLSTFAAPDYNGISPAERDFFNTNIRYLWPHLVDTDFYGDLLETSNDMIRRVARENDLPLVDVFRELKGGRAFFLDNCHLKTKGRLKQARIFYEGLRKILDGRIGIAADQTPRGAGTPPWAEALLKKLENQWDIAGTAELHKSEKISFNEGDQSVEMIFRIGGESVTVSLRPLSKEPSFAKTLFYDVSFASAGRGTLSEEGEQLVKRAVSLARRIETGDDTDLLLGGK